jgi:hypothetical protein
MYNFGDYIHKKSIWEEFWEYRETASNLSRAHDMSTTWLKVVKVSLDIAGLQRDDIVLPMSIASVLLKVIESALSLNPKILAHERAAQNYAFLEQNVRRIMSLKRSTVQLSENMEIISNLFATIEQHAPPVPSWLCCFENTDIGMTPNIPVSPPDSTSPSRRDRQISPAQYTVWKSDYKIMTSSSLSDFSLDRNSVGHFKCDVSGVITVVDDVCCSLIGLPEEDILSPTGFGWTAKLHIDDYRRISSQWLECVRTSTSFIEKYRFVPNNDFTVVYVIGETHPVYRNNILQGYEGILVHVPLQLWEEFDVSQLRNENAYMFNATSDIEV